MIAAMSATALGSIMSGQSCTPAGTTLAMKWNAYASEMGAYEITGCTGVNPTLSLAAGTEYTFDQSDASNWCATRPLAAHLASRAAARPAPPARPASPPSRVPKWLSRACHRTGTTRSALRTSRAARTRSACIPLKVWV